MAVTHKQSGRPPDPPPQPPQPPRTPHRPHPRFDPPTPMEFEPNGTSSRTTHTIYAFLQDDLSAAQGVSVNNWTESRFGLPEGGLTQWADEISALNWFDDEVIRGALGRYCAAREEHGRYGPFVELTDRIVELARGALTGVDSKYPVDDFCFVDNHNNTVDTIKERDGLGARRKPDGLAVRRAIAKRIGMAKQIKALRAKSEESNTHVVRWVDILAILEFKLRQKLLAKLNEERRRRGLRELDESGICTETKVCYYARIYIISALSSLCFSQTAPDEASAMPTKTRSREPPADPSKANLLAGIASYDESGPPFGVIPSHSHVAVEVAIQAASYALELLSCTHGTRASCFSSILIDDGISLWYYDAAGVVYTAEFVSLIDDFEIFAAIIVGFANCTPEQFGVLPCSVVQPHVPYSRKFPPENLDEHTLYLSHPATGERVAVTLDQSIFAAYGMLGRRTFLYSINTDPIVSDKELIMKMSYQASTRRQEYQLVRTARKAKVGHLPKVHMWGDLWKLSDGVRSAFYTKSDGRAEYEDRTLRAIVYTRYTPSRDVLADDCRLIPLMVDQMLDCKCLLHLSILKSHPPTYRSSRPSLQR